MIDFSDVEELRITEEDFDQIVAQDYYAAVFRPGAVVVIVAPRDEVFALANTWQRRIEDIGWKTYIARSRVEARGWFRENFPQAVRAVPTLDEPSRQDAT